MEDSEVDALTTAPGSWTVLHVPESHWDKSLQTFDWSRQPRPKRQAVAEWMAWVRDGVRATLVLFGPPGVGKTHLAVGLYRWYVAGHSAREAVFVECPDWYGRFKREYGERPPDGTMPRWSWVDDARGLVALDDPLGKELSEHELGEILPRLIMTPYNNGASVIVTMNHDPRTQLADYLSPHETDRLLEHPVRVVQMIGPSGRRGT